MCAYVGTAYAVGKTAADAVSIMCDFEQHLLKVWGQHIKPDSKIHVQAKGINSYFIDDDWKMVDEFPVMGHALTRNGSVMRCWERTRTAMWKAYVGTCKAKAMSRAAFSQTVALLTRACEAPMASRCSLWPPQHTRARYIDSTQTQCLLLCSMLLLCCANCPVITSTAGIT